LFQQADMLEQIEALNAQIPTALYKDCMASLCVVLAKEKNPRARALEKRASALAKPFPAS